MRLGWIAVLLIAGCAPQQGPRLDAAMFRCVGLPGPPDLASCDRVVADTSREPRERALALSVRGALALDRGDWQLGRSETERALALAPDNPTIREAYGTMLLRLGEPEPAARELAVAVEGARRRLAEAEAGLVVTAPPPGSPVRFTDSRLLRLYFAQLGEVELHLAEAQLAAGQVAAAKDSLGRARGSLSLAQRDGWKESLWCVARVRAGERDAGLRSCHAVLRSSDPRALRLAAGGFLAADQPTWARIAIDAAMQVVSTRQPAHPETLFLQAAIGDRIGTPGEARAAREAARSLDPFLDRRWGPVFGLQPGSTTIRL